MKRKIYMLTIAVLFLLIMPLQYGCDKAEDELQPQQIEEQGGSEEYTNENRLKSGFDPASATYDNDRDEINQILTYWQQLNYQLCYNPCYLDREAVLELWYNEGDMRADEAFVILYLQNLDKLSLGRGIAASGEMLQILVDCWNVPKATVSVITALANTAKHMITAMGLIGDEMNCEDFYIDFDNPMFSDDLVEAISGTSYYIYGDANEDGTINMQDVTYIELIIFERRDPTRFADANNDGRINMQDVTRIDMLMAGTAKRVWFGKF